MHIRLLSFLPYSRLYRQTPLPEMSGPSTYESSGFEVGKWDHSKEDHCHVRSRYIEDEGYQVEIPEPVTNKAIWLERVARNFVQYFSKMEKKK